MATGSYLCFVRAIGIKQLKNKLSEYVKIAASGEVVLVTDRDRVVAELGPPTPGRARSLTDARLAEAVRMGSVSPPTSGPGTVPPRTPVTSFDILMRDLEKDRGER